MFVINVDRERGTVVLTLRGDLDMETVDAFARSIEEHLGPPGSALTVKVHELTFCDSRGLAALVAAADRCREAGVTWRLTGPSGNVARVMAITGVDTLLAEG